MEFLYMFTLIFLLVFGVTMLVKVALGALFSSGSKRDIYVRMDENIEEFIGWARGSRQIGRIYLLVPEGDSEKAQSLAEKYDVRIVDIKGR